MMFIWGSAKLLQSYTDDLEVSLSDLANFPVNSPAVHRHEITEAQESG
jgi:hypothetical protein